MSKSHRDLRAFRGLAGALLTIVVGCGGNLAEVRKSLTDEPGECAVGAVDDATLAALDADVESRLGIRVDVAQQACTRVGCRPVDGSEGRMTVDMYRALGEELGRYGAGFLRQYGPKVVWLVADLKSSLASWEAAGVALGAERVIYLNVGSACTPEARRSVIHHEVFHVLDGQIFRSDDANWQWRALNPPEFSYSQSYEAGLQEMHPSSGFVTDYATTNMGEDRAELYRFQVAQPYAELLDSWIEGDRYLRAKDQALRALLEAAWPSMTPESASSSSTSAVATAAWHQPSPGILPALQCGGTISQNSEIPDGTVTWESIP